MSDFLRRKPLLLGVLLLFATLLVYFPVVHHEFLTVWDDNLYITENNHIRSGLTLANLKWAFTAMQPFYWQPLTLLSHMEVCQLFGLNSGAHHYVNVLLHATNVLLLFLLLRRATGAVGRSFLVAALFALHPTNVETVAWAAERNSLLNTLFSLLTIAAYGWYLQRPGWQRYVLIVAALLLALMSKPVAVTLPLILLLLDYWPLNRCEDLPFLRRWGRLFLEKLPLLLICLGVSALTLAGERASGTDIPLSVLPMSMRLENAVISYVAYIGEMLWPARLSPFYPHPMDLGSSLPWGEFAASVLVLAAITALVLSLRSKRFALMGWLFFLTTLVPMIGLVQTGSHARQDHFTYIPDIGLFIFLVWGLSAALERISNARVVPVLASLCLLTGYATATANYLPYWHDSVKLFTRAATLAGPPHPLLEMALGDALVFAGRYDEAYPHYRETCVLRPEYANCHYDMAEILYYQHHLRGALEQYHLAASLTESRDLALSCLVNSGEILMALGDYQSAETKITAALQIDPNNSAALGLRHRISNHAFLGMQ